MTPFVRVEREALPAGLRAYAVRGDGSSLTVRVSAELPPGAQRRAVRKALHAAHVDVLPVLPAVLPAVTGGAATAARRFALHPLTALAGSAVAGVAAMILTAGPAAPPLPADSGASLPGPGSVIPAPHHHHRRRPPAGAPGAGPAPSSPAAGGTAGRHSPPPGGRHPASPAPSSKPRPSTSPSPAATWSPSPAPPAPGPSPSAPPPPAQAPPAQAPPAPGGVLCVNLQPVLGLCLLKAA